MRVALAIFLALHGVAHLVGFVGSWGLVSSVPSRTGLFAGRIPVGSNGMKVIGILWLVTAVMFVAAGIGRMIDTPWAPALIVIAALVSLMLSVSALPAARIGVAINVAILTAFAIASRTTLELLNR